MDKKVLLLSSLIAASMLTACSDDDDDNNSGTPAPTPGNQTETEQILASLDLTAPDTYTFESKVGTGSSVSYSGQTARQMLIADLTSAIGALTTANGMNLDDAVAPLQFFIDGDDIDTTDYTFSLAGQTVTPGPTYGDISTGKNLIGKIAGGYIQDDDTVGGENTRWADATGSFGANGRFYGWEDIVDTDLEDEIVRPIDLLNNFIGRAALGSINDGFQINNGAIDIDTAYLDQYGRDYKQLAQKFALGAVTFSQGTADYLQTDFQAGNYAEEGKSYTEAEHKWDEAFGYFGAARNYNDYTDDEIAGKGGRDGWSLGYYDTDQNGEIDLKSEINLANSTNCAKRDRGAEEATDFTKTAFDAFVAGRAVLNNAASRATTVGVNAPLTEAEVTALNKLGRIAGETWEKCVAATVIHYINDTIGDMGNFSGGEFADKANFTDLAKHWGEMKGFALGLQFSPYSPFNADAASVDKLEKIYELMGDAPVLADGTQLGNAFEGGVAQYQADLEEARAMLQEAYGFSDANTANW